jgi:tRNA U34 5-carboxymethylaminomethyl modifying GTPase MnmE/TrmE
LLDETRGCARIVVLSKSDLRSSAQEPSLPAAVRTSVKAEGGLEGLHARLADEVGARTGVDGDEGGIVASLRQLELLDGLSRSLGAASTAFEAEPLEIALVDLRSALEAVSALLGIEVGDAVLDTVFAKFCVGK